MGLLLGFLGYLIGLAAIGFGFLVAVVYFVTHPSLPPAKDAAPLAQTEREPEAATFVDRAAPTAAAQTEPEVSAARGKAKPAELAGPAYGRWAREKALRRLGIDPDRSESSRKRRVVRPSSRQAVRPSPRRVAPKRLPREAAEAYGAVEPAPRPDPDAQMFKLHKVY